MILRANNNALRFVIAKRPLSFCEKVFAQIANNFFLSLRKWHPKQLKILRAIKQL